MGEHSLQEFTIKGKNSMSSKQDYIQRVLISHEEIVAYCQSLARSIEAQYEGKPLTLVCILKGSVPFLAELSKHFTRTDVIFEYIRVSSYEGATTETTGKAKLTNMTFTSLEGQHVIIIEDIIDTGLTIAAVYESLSTYGAASLKVATLLDKVERRLVDWKPDFVGFTIPNEFVIGFGLDYDEKYRNLKDIVVPNSEEL